MTAKHTRKPMFTVTEPSEYNGHKWYADSKKLSIRYGPYDSREAAQASCDHLNELVTL